MPTKTRKNATMTAARYRATVAKLQAAYDALNATYDLAEHFERVAIGRAMSALWNVPDTLRVQVCDLCSKHGNWENPDIPGTYESCSHPDVPKIKLGDRNG